MSSETATPHPTAAQTPASAPHPVAPSGGMPVDGSAVTFSWTAAPGVRTYRLQVAAEADFKQVVCTLESGPTTLCTLLEMLPQDGSVFHWRVQAQTASGWQPWSPVAHFKARTDQHEIAFRTKHEAAAKHAAQPGTVARAEPSTHAAASVQAATEPELYQISRTSKGTIVLIMAFMLVSFAVVFAYMAYVVTSAQ